MRFEWDALCCVLSHAYIYAAVPCLFWRASGPNCESASGNQAAAVRGTMFWASARAGSSVRGRLPATAWLAVRAPNRYALGLKLSSASHPFEGACGGMRARRENEALDPQTNAEGPTLTHAQILTPKSAI
jgi:hypothetical protein